MVALNSKSRLQSNTLPRANKVSPARIAHANNWLRESGIEARAITPEMRPELARQIRKHLLHGNHLEIGAYVRNYGKVRLRDVRADSLKSLRTTRAQVKY